MLSTEKIEWTVGDLISKNPATLSMGQNLLKLACMVAPDMCDYQNVSQIFDIFFCLGIHGGSVKLGPKMVILKWKWVLLLKILKKIWDTFFKFNL